MAAMRSTGGLWRTAWCRSSVLLALLATTASAEYHEVDDIKAFGLLDVKGHFSAGYLLDDRDRSTGGGTEFETRATWQEDLFVLTESFIYHPGFLNMEFGGGPLLVQQQYESNFGDVSESDTLLNFVARLNFLEIKNYPLSVYYERSHPSVTTSLAGRFLTRNDVYGLNQHISGLFGGSTTTSVALSRQESNGEGFGSVVDNIVERAQFGVETSYREKDVLAFRVDRLDQDSASGSAGLPIVRSLLEQRIDEVRANNHFGRDGRLSVRQLFRRLQQDRLSFDQFTLDDLTYQGNLRWDHAENGHTYLRYRTLDAERTDADLRTRDLSAGLARRVLPNLDLDAAVGHLADEQTGFKRDRSDARGALTWVRETGFGSVGVAGSVRAARTDQVSSEDDIQVIGEPVTLVGTTPVDLQNQFVVPGSVVVSNSNRTQIYVEGLDYRLITIGSATSIQRLLNGAITDGETVLVDYAIETPGTAVFDTLGSGLSLNVNMLGTIDAFARYDWQDTEIREGSLNNPVNDRQRFEIGIGASNQFLDGWSLDGELRHTRNDEEISPYDSNTFNLSLTTSLGGTLSLVLSGNLTEVDYENSPEDIQQVGYRVALGGRLFRRSRFSYEASFLEDTGGTRLRREIRHRLLYQWAFRQVRFELQGMYRDETLGITERGNLHVSAYVTRVF
jgi:hypothetical protein